MGLNGLKGVGNVAHYLPMGLINIMKGEKENDTLTYVFFNCYPSGSDTDYRSLRNL